VKFQVPKLLPGADVPIASCTGNIRKILSGPTLKNAPSLQVHRWDARSITKSLKSAFASSYGHLNIVQDLQCFCSAESSIDNVGLIAVPTGAPDNRRTQKEGTIPGLPSQKATSALYHLMPLSLSCTTRQACLDE
jgi:hypothetical protein